MTRGFDAFVGNPPWVSFAGRAAQPLDDGLRLFFDDAYESFAGFKNLQGLFVERCATLLGDGGRLGLVLPSSMSEQDGYGPTRLAHDRRCACDAELRDFGEDAFSGVVQPCMALVSTRRAASIALDAPAPWPVERRDLDSVGIALVERLSRTPMPEHLFGERGLQTSGDDVQKFSREPDASHSVALRAGGDVQPFVRRKPSFYADPSALGKRLRSPEDWATVRLFVRQTARFPIVARSDGVAFRNSILAGFEDADHPADFLVAYLNATPIRWLHYVRNRDARQGLPQVKIGHLRATPAPARSSLVDDVTALGRTLSARNDGISAREQDALDDLVADMFDVLPAERELLRRFRETVR